MSASGRLPLTWELSVIGAEQVKQRMQELQDQFQRGDISAQQYARGLRIVSRDAAILSRNTQITSRLFLAQHPTINALSRGMSGLAGVLHTVVSAQNALNLAMLTMQSTNSAVAEADADVAQKQRELAAARERLMSGRGSPKEVADAEDALNVALAKQKEAHDELAQQRFSNIVTLSATLGTLTASIIGAIPKILEIKENFSEVAKSISTAFGLKDAKEEFTGALRSFNNIADTESKGLKATFLSAFGTQGLLKDTIFDSTSDKSMKSRVARALGGAALIGAGGALLGTGGLDAIFKSLNNEATKTEDKIKAIAGTAAIGVGVAVEFPELSKIALIGTVIATATVAIIVFKDEIAGFFNTLKEQGGVLGDFIATIEELFTLPFDQWTINASVRFGAEWTKMWNGAIDVANKAIVGIEEAYLNVFNPLRDIAPIKVPDQTPIDFLGPGRISGKKPETLQEANELVDIMASAVIQANEYLHNQQSVTDQFNQQYNAARDINGILADNTSQLQKQSQYAGQTIQFGSQTVKIPESAPMQISPKTQIAAPVTSTASQPLPIIQQPDLRAIGEAAMNPWKATSDAVSAATQSGVERLRQQFEDSRRMQEQVAEEAKRQAAVTSEQDLINNFSIDYMPSRTKAAVTSVVQQYPVQVEVQPTIPNDTAQTIQEQIDAVPEPAVALQIDTAAIDAAKARLEELKTEANRLLGGGSLTLDKALKMGSKQFGPQVNDVLDQIREAQNEIAGLQTGSTTGQIQALEKQLKQMTGGASMETLERWKKKGALGPEVLGVLNQLQEAKNGLTQNTANAASAIVAQAQTDVETIGTNLTDTITNTIAPNADTGFQTIVTSATNMANALESQFGAMSSSIIAEIAKAIAKVNDLIAKQKEAGITVAGSTKSNVKSLSEMQQEINVKTSSTLRSAPLTTLVPSPEPAPTTTPKKSAFSGQSFMFGSMPVTVAAEGLETSVNKPSLILAGERGEEVVSIIPKQRFTGNLGGKSGGDVFAPNIYITVEGSVRSDKDLLSLVEGYLTRELRKRGVRGTIGVS